MIEVLVGRDVYGVRVGQLLHRMGLCPTLERPALPLSSQGLTISKDISQPFREARDSVALPF